MTTKTDVQRWGETLSRAIETVATKKKFDEFMAQLQQGMQPQQTTKQVQQGTKFQPIPNAGAPYSPEVIQRGGMDVPNMVSQTQTTQPNILEVLAKLSPEYPGMVNQQVQNQQAIGQAAKAPWMEQTRGGLATNMVTGQKIENPFESAVSSTQKNSDEVSVGEPYLSKDKKHWLQDFVPVDPVYKKPVEGGQKFTKTVGQPPQARPTSGLQDKRLIKSYQDSFNRDPAIKTYKDQGMSLAAVNGIIGEAKKGNQVSASALGVKMAKTMGEVGMLSESDVTRYVQAKALDRSAADKLSKWIKGVPTDATLNDIQQIADVMRARFTEQIQPIINSYAQQMSTGIGITEDEALNYLASERLIGGTGSTPTPTGRTKKLEEMSDAELDAYEKSLTGGK
jgi:hypothetical protein